MWKSNYVIHIAPLHESGNFVNGEKSEYLFDGLACYPFLGKVQMAAKNE